jgi:hypothetical protein
MNNAVDTSALNNLSTSKLFDFAHQSLLAGKFSQGRAALDELGLRSDNRDLLSSVEAYKVPPEIRQLIQDRIELVNAKASHPSLR